MIRISNIWALTAAVFLSACVGGMSLLETQIFPQGFSGNLSHEYGILSTYEQKTGQNDELVEYYDTKARRARMGGDVMPARPDESDIPAFARDDLVNAHALLLDALKTLRGDGEYGALLALAQTRYDCWLKMQVEIRERGYFACKEHFGRAMALLEDKIQKRNLYAVYFDSGSIALTEQGLKTVQDIAQRYKHKEGWVLFLKGFTDSTGSRAQNKILSMRRAIAVKNYLAQNGVLLEDIVVSAEGEIATAAEEEDGTSRRVEIMARPVSLSGKMNIKIAPGWTHSVDQAF